MLTTTLFLRRMRNKHVEYYCHRKLLVTNAPLLLSKSNWLHVHRLSKSFHNEPTASPNVAPELAPCGVHDASM